MGKIQLKEKKSLIRAFVEGEVGKKVASTKGTFSGRSILGKNTNSSQRYRACVS